MNGVRRAAFAVLVTTMVLSCTDAGPSSPRLPDELPAAPQGIVTSNPSTPSPSSNITAARASDAAYISAVPGSLPGALTVSIRNRTTNGSPFTVIVVNGGFDPVSVEAEAGDEIELGIRMPTGTDIVGIKVPPRRPPSVVRTSPAKGRSDVALNVQIEVIFSEPMEKSSLTASAMSLASSGVSLTGHVEISDDELSATFIPDEQLKPGTSYSLTIANTVRDRDGDTLEGDATITFATLPEPGRIAGQLAFLSDRDGNTEIYTAAAGGAGLLRLTRNAGYDGEIAWSPDGNRIAFVSQRGESPGKRDIYIMNADGSGVTQLTTTGHSSHPTWSPDGKQIAYAYDESQSVFGHFGGDIAIIDVEKGEASRRYLGLALLQGVAQPVWVPDGTRILFLADRGYYDAWRSVMTVKPDGTSLERLIDGGDVSFSSPHFSADGTKLTLDYCRGNDALIQCVLSAGIAVATYPGGGINYVMDRRNRSYWPWQYAAEFLPAISPDGSGLVFTAWACKECPIGIGYAAIDGAGFEILIENAYGAEWRPSR